MAVVDNIPFIVKILCPPLFLLTLIRRWFHKKLIVHYGPQYLKACASVLQPFYDEIRRNLTEASRKGSPTVVEYGAGPQPMFDAFPTGSHVIIIEPCTDFHPYLEEAWRKSHLYENGKFTLVPTKVEDADANQIADGSVDVVTSRLVNCSVSDTTATFKQVNRMLKKSGRYYFWDHIRSDSWFILTFQYIMAYTIISFFTDCNPARRPFENLKKAGFSDVKVKKFRTPLEGAFMALYSETGSGYAEK